MTEGTGNKDRGTRTITLPADVHRRAKIAIAELDVKLGKFVAEAVTEKLDAMEARSRKTGITAVVRKRPG